MITIDNIDVFILSYNREEYILDTIQSLKKQTIGDFKITILDNGSTDNTEKLIDGLNDKNISFIGSNTNQGVLWNFQRAQELASKKWTILFHDDDLIHPKYLEYVIRVLNENNTIDLVGSGMLATNRPLFDKFKNYKYNPKFFDKVSLASLVYSGFPLNFSTIVYKTTYFKQANMDFDIYGKIADRPFIYDCIKDGNVAIFQGQYIQYRIHNNQDSKNNKTGPFYNQTIALHKKYKNMIFDSHTLIARIIFLIYFYKYLKEEYSRFINIDMSFQGYVDKVIYNLKLSNKLLILSKIFYFLRMYIIYKTYRAIKRKYGEYS